MRAPRPYIPGYDTPSYAAGLCDFLRERAGRGRPKTPNEIKIAKREADLYLLLMDICYLKLRKLKSATQIAEILHRKLPKKYPRKRKTKSTDKIVQSQLRKKVTMALQFLLEKPDRVKELLEMSRKWLDEMEKRYPKYLAK
jgi:hypothetical protein